jgi:glycosyltransferase involved in cell wall biosynthesis
MPIKLPDQMSTKIKILIISQYFPPDISGGGTRAWNYAKCLSMKGFDVTVITAFPHLHSDVPKQYKGKLTITENLQGVKIIRVWIPSLLHTSVKNRISLHTSFIFSSLLPLFTIKPDIIFASEPNLFSIIPSYIYSKVKGGKVIRVVDDLWPEVIYERKYVKSKIFKKILDSLAKFSYTYPKCILPLTNEAKIHIQKTYDINQNKVIVIEHGVDESVYHYKIKKRENEFVLMYSGAIVESYNFDLILEAAKKLKDKKIVFIIRGKGWLLKSIRESKEKYNLENVIIDDKIVPFNQISEVLSKADAFLIPMKDEYTLNLSLPTKILEYQTLGRPIICCSLGAPGNYIKNTKSGIRLDYNNLDDFVETILELEKNVEKCKELGKNGRIFVEQNLTFEHIGNRLSKIIHDIMT